MIDLTVEIKNEAVIQTTLAGITSQLPYATSVAINKTLDSAQAAIRATLPQHFTLRRKDFIDKTIYIAPRDRAKKDRLIGTVRVNPERDFLAKFETDTHKVPRSGNSLAVPIFRATDKNRIVTRSDPLYLKKIMQAIDEKDGKLKVRGKKGQPKPGPLGDVFVLTTAKGTFVMQRPVSGPDRSGNRSNLKVLYAFPKEVPIKPDLHFDLTAMDAAVKAWPANVLEAIDYAIRTAK